jgi:hypothetical protein
LHDSLEQLSFKALLRPLFQACKFKSLRARHSFVKNTCLFKKDSLDFSRNIVKSYPLKKEDFYPSLFSSRQPAFFAKFQRADRKREKKKAEASCISKKGSILAGRREREKERRKETDRSTGRGAVIREER